MTREQFNSYLNVTMILSLVLAGFSLLRVKARGPSAYFQAAAWLVMAGTLLSLKLEAPRAVTTVAGIMVATCMALDVFFRNPTEEKKP